MDPNPDKANEAKRAFFLARFGRLDRNALIALVQESKQWKYGDIVLKTRTTPQLLEIWYRIWLDRESSS